MIVLALGAYEYASFATSPWRCSASSCSACEQVPVEAEKPVAVLGHHRWRLEKRSSKGVHACGAWYLEMWWSRQEVGESLADVELGNLRPRLPGNCMSIAIPAWAWSCQSVPLQSHAARRAVLRWPSDLD